MCGICGFVSDTTEITTSEFYSALRAVSHRGPDDEGLVAISASGPASLAGDATAPDVPGVAGLDAVRASNVILGHRRLSILDLTPGGHQPFADASGRYQLVYNGEVFNYIEIRRELESLGHAFRTTCDTEVVLHALMQWGTDAFNRFNGMWALGLWDNRDRSLLLSRDRFGIKPLYYSARSSTLRFASEPGALRALLGPGELDAGSAIRYLDSCLLNDTEATFWTDVSELAPGTWALWEAGELKIARYWDFEPDPQLWSDEEAVERFAEIFEDSLRLRMRSDVPVGTLLSGGLDSSLIVATLHHLGLLGDGMFDAFSAVFDEEEYSERRYVELLTERLPLKPHWVTPNPLKIEEDLEAVFRHVGQPFRSLAVYSQHLLYRAVRERSAVEVLLNGQGADEVFGGYDRHYYALFGELFSRGRWGRMLREMRMYADARDRELPRVLRQSLGHMRRALRQPDYLTSTLFSDVTRTPLREYLTYEDRNSMAASLESRVPFLDYRLVEFAFRMDASQKISGFENKRVERTYARRRLPAAITERTDKMGFVSPQDEWQRAYLKPAILAARGSLLEWTSSGFATGRTDMVDRFDAYFAAPSGGDWPFAWRVYCLDRWLRFVGLA